MNTIQLLLIVSTFSFAMGILLDWIITTHGKNHQGKWSKRILAVLLAVSFGANFANAQNVTKLQTENENLQTSLASYQEKNYNLSRQVGNRTGTMVYITPTGTKYHRASCSYIKGSSTKIDLYDAKRQGYGPCSRCHRPEGENELCLVSRFEKKRCSL